MIIKINKKISIFIFTLSFVFVSNAQEIDSLKKYSFDDLISKFYNSDSIIQFNYAEKYFEKAKIIEDTAKIVNGFYLLSEAISNKKLEKYNNQELSLYDSIIKYSNITKTGINKHFPSVAHSNKGDIYYENENFKEALENYILALKTAKSDSTYTNRLNYRIANIKLRFNENLEGLEILKGINKFYLNHQKLNENDKDYLFTIFSLGHAYLRNKQLDSANYFYDKGYSISLKLKDTIFKSYFILAKGVLEYHNNNNSAAIDSINKSIKGLEIYDDNQNLSYANHFLGKSYFQLKEYGKAYYYFKKVDSIYNILNDLHPDLRETYPYLIENAKSSKNFKEQLYYTNQLLRLDSIYFTNYMNIHKNIYERIDREQLNKDKKKLSSKVKNEKEKNGWFIAVILFISIVSISLLWKNFNQKKRYKKIYLELRGNSKDETKTSYSSPKKVENRTEIGKEIVQDLLLKLEIFESNNEFLDSKVQLSFLAKKIKTNSRYLSIVINNYKQKNFTQYINDLRIDYIIHELNNNSVYRKYTIDGIAEEIGFKSGESFSKAFYKKTGIYPSLFIKNLNNENVP